MNKSHFRKEFLLKREAMFESDLIERNMALEKMFLSYFEFGKIKVLHHFLPLTVKSEVDTNRLVAAVKLLNPRIKVVVPRVNRKTKELEHLESTPETLFLKSPWGIREPVGDDLVDETMIDMVLVPLLCFDRLGHRVGYGGGYYDRFLAKVRLDCLKVGLSFFGPVDEIADIHEGDVRLDCCVTPDRVFDFR